jgi:hypothetical protein
VCIVASAGELLTEPLPSNGLSLWLHNIVLQTSWTQKYLGHTQRGYFITNRFIFETTEDGVEWEDKNNKTIEEGRRIMRRSNKGMRKKASSDGRKGEN